MIMSYGQFRQLDFPSLTNFVSQRVEEGPYLDYKLTIAFPLTTPDKKEFLKDISGLANAGGGMIIYGCDEPTNHQNWQSQLTGVANGADLATALERVAASGIDPRIPGFDIRAIPLANGLHCLIAYVPTSSVKPHMVIYSGSNRFYIRHSESTTAMTTQEVRSTVLSAYNREEQIEKLKSELLAQIGSTSNFYPRIIIQAIPLTDLPIRWHVYSEPVQSVLRGQSRDGQFVKELSLRYMNSPSIDVEELYVESTAAQGLAWKLGARANGHVYLIYREFPSARLQLSEETMEERPYFTGFYNQIFCAFGSVVDELQNQTGTAHGYRIYCELQQVGNLFLQNSVSNNYDGPLEKNTLHWPIRNVPPANSVEFTCSTMGETIYQAFHRLPDTGELKIRGDGV